MTKPASPKAPTTLIMGASSGVGLAIAKRWRAEGREVLGVGRRGFDDIVAPPFSRGHYLVCDLADPDTAVASVQAFLDHHGIEHLAVFLYAAGVGYYGRFEDQSAAAIEAMTAVHALTPIALTRSLAPRFSQSQLVFISSIAAFAPAPKYAVYAATKALLTSFVKNLQIEEAGRIKIQCVHLGPVRTDFHRRSGVPVGQFDDTRWDSAEGAAQKICRGLNKKNPNLFSGLSGRLLKAVGQRMPEALTWLQRGKTHHAQTPIHHAVVTGGANGIGRAIVESSASNHGTEISLIDRDATRGQMLAKQLADADAGGVARCLAADLTAPDAIPQLVASLAEHPPIDLLVLNAGINRATPFFHGDTASDSAMIRLNFLSPILFVHALLDAGRLATGGTIVLIASLSTFVTYPGAAVYGGTKDGLHAFGQSLREILKPKNIRVLIVYPGPTETDQARSNSPGNPVKSKRMPPAVLAEKILHAVERHRRWLIPGFTNTLIAFIARCFPWLIQQMMRRVIYEKSAKK